MHHLKMKLCISRCSCEKSNSECAFQTGRISISAADETDTEAITFLFKERTIVVNRCNCPSCANQLATTQYVRALREEIIFETEEDCIVVSCRKLNPQKVHDELLRLKITDIVELSGWSFQIMCDPYDTGIQQLQIRLVSRAFCAP